MKTQQGTSDTIIVPQKKLTDLKPRPGLTSNECHVFVLGSSFSLWLCVKASERKTLSNPNLTEFSSIVYGMT